MPAKTRIVSEIDFAQEGRQLGYLRLPHSVHRSAYGWLPVPAASLRNGAGPTSLLMAGNHGDEYEGQVLLARLIGELKLEEIRGQLIILPMANFPAAAAGLRTSPIDQGNLNRSFPGDPDGTPTQMLAHVIEEVLLPDCDYLLDLHSGGSSLVYLPTLLAAVNEDGSIPAALWPLLQAFDAPYTLVFPPSAENRTSDCGGKRKGVTSLTTEMGGGGTVSPEALAIAGRGVLRLLDQVGHLHSPAAVSAEPSRSEILTLSAEHYCYSPEAGVLEPLVALGDHVEAGDPAARIHFPETPGKAPLTVHFETSGMVICRRQPARVERGDCLFHQGVKWEGEVVEGS